MDRLTYVLGRLGAELTDEVDLGVDFEQWPPRNPP